MDAIPFYKHCLSAIVLAAFSSVNQGAAWATSLTEYTVKAAYLSKFGNFVQWPTDTFPEPTSPLNLCIVGTDPFGHILDEVADGLHVDSHPIQIKRLAATDHPMDCQIVYVDGNDTRQALQIVNALRGTNVLTVTDTGSETAGAGIINFLIKDDRVRFGVDDEAAARNGLTISSRLLMLAVYVRDYK